MKLTLKESKKVLNHISLSGPNGLNRDYKASGLYEYLREHTNPELSDFRCEQIIQCLVHNYKPNSEPIDIDGRIITWEDWLRDMVGAEPQTYEESIKELKDG
jgi:hypothetical protein